MEQQPDRPLNDLEAHALAMSLPIAQVVSDLVRDGHDYEAVRAWFAGSNPRLEDGIPALLLRSEAARSFASRTP